ncbi:hypothetical protein OH492_18815 [Vibrio chagasii]|nr:hypothetical protein [Vibrio chagasii]
MTIFVVVGKLKWRQVDLENQRIFSGPQKKAIMPISSGKLMTFKSTNIGYDELCRLTTSDLQSTSWLSPPMMRKRSMLLASGESPRELAEPVGLDRKSNLLSK